MYIYVYIYILLSLVKFFLDDLISVTKAIVIYHFFLNFYSIKIDNKRWMDKKIILTLLNIRNKKKYLYSL